MELPKTNVLFILMLVLVSVTSVLCQGVCTGMTSCYCRFENGQFVDIAGLARFDGLPRFVNISDSHELTYSWNPCFNFTEGACDQVALCSMEEALPHDIYRPLGYQNQTYFTTNTSDNSVTLVYETDTRKAYIHLICDTSGLNDTYFTAIGPKSQLSSEYYFELRSQLACVQGIPRTSTAKPGTPGHTISPTLEGVLITIGILAVIVGVGLTTFILKKKGKIFKKPSYDEI